jgi:glycosyltransferase involved in cell wall biosynthesis
MNRELRQSEIASSRPQTELPEWRECTDFAIRHLSIAQFAPLAEAVPPRAYGGTERVVSYLTEELVRQGHDVTLFASGDSQTTAELVSCAPAAMRVETTLQERLPETLAMLETLRSRLEAFDILHFHSDLLRFPMFRGMTARAVTTLHLPPYLAESLPFVHSCPGASLVSVSNDQQRGMPALNWVGTVHHGLPPNLLEFNCAPSRDYLAFLGRISPEKGPDRAVEIALRAGLKIRIAAKIGEPDLDYFKRRISPLLDNPLVEFVGEITEPAKNTFLGNARALLFPIDWQEPFGLVMIEAMACGTPVIAFPCGAVPEVIEDGVTGFIVENVEMAVRAVSHIDRLDRMRIRKRFEARFSVTRMTRDYLRIYQSLLHEPASSL